MAPSRHREHGGVQCYRADPCPYGLAYPPRVSMTCRPSCGLGKKRTAPPQGQVEVVSSLERDGQSLPYDIRFGVWVVFEGDTEYIRRCFTEYGVRTDPSGLCVPVQALAPDRPGGGHLRGLHRRAPRADGLSDRLPGRRGRHRETRPHAGRVPDGEGGYTVVGRLLPPPTRSALAPCRLAWRTAEDHPAGRCREWCAGRMWWSMRPTAPCVYAGRWSRCALRRRLSS